MKMMLGLVASAAFAKEHARKTSTSGQEIVGRKMTDRHFAAGLFLPELHREVMFVVPSRSIVME